MGVRFLHTADLHLGSPLESAFDADEARSEDLRRATYETLDRLVSLAIEQAVEFVVVSGDLYDERARSVEANEYLVDQFSRLDEHDIDCYVVHGNHDPLYDGAERLEWPENVHVFSADDVESITHIDGDRPVARILGRSYGQQWESGKLYYHYTPPDGSVPNIGLLHTGLNPDGRKYAPCSPSDLSSKDVDYWALGHIHTPQVVNGAPAAYSGIPQGRRVGEADVGGCFLVELEAGGEPDIEFIPVSPVVWRQIAVDIGNAETADGKSVGTLNELVTHLVDRCQSARETTYSEQASEEVNAPIGEVDWDPTAAVLRVDLVGRGEIHDQLDIEAVEWLQKQLHERLPSGGTAVWIESLRQRTSPPLPDDETLRDEDETIDELHTLVAELRDDPTVRDALRDETGEVWEWTGPEESEDLPEDRLRLDDERLDEFIDRALQRATERIAMENYDVD